MEINDSLFIIPAREGSKGLFKKNIRLLQGKPLIQYTLDAARKLAPDDKIIVSTDSIEIKKLVENMGLQVPFLRPAELATDNAGTYDVLLHALNFYEQKNPPPAKIVLLQPTSPFRNEEHIKAALDLYQDTLDMVVSVKETTSNPYYVLREENKEGYLVQSKRGNFQRRQDCPPVWELNGAIYIINIKSLKTASLTEFTKVKKYVMDEISSHDIDTLFDWKMAEGIISDSLI